MGSEDDESIRTGEHGVARGFGRGLVMVLILAAAVRLAYIVGVHADFPLTGDAWVYHHEARFVANGRGFVNPVAWRYDKLVKQAADHPPLYIAVLALSYLVGVQSNLGQLLLNGLIGVTTVALVALLTRRLVGDRGGLIAGVIAALYPGMWAWNGQILSESLSTLMVVAVVMVAYRYLEDRSVRRAALLGGIIGLAALSRSELLVLALLIPALVLAHYRAGRGVAQLARHAAVAVALLAMVVAPWTAYNLSRFDRPVLFGTGLGRALASGSCPETIDGGATGFWFIHCVDTPMGMSKADQRDLDESELDDLYRRHAVQVMSDNRGRMPVVLVARVGRMFQYWAPLQQLRFDQLSETREWWVTGAAFSTFYLLAAGAAVGAMVLRRRRVRVYLLVLPIGVAAVGAMMAFGTSRYRATCEPCLVVLAAVGIDAAVRRYERRRSSKASTRSAPARPGRDRALVTAGGPAHPDGDARFAPRGTVGARVIAGPGPGGGEEDWSDDPRVRALWTGRSGGGPAPADPGHAAMPGSAGEDPGGADGEQAMWVNEDGNWTDGHHIWDEEQGSWTEDPRAWADGSRALEWDSASVGAGQRGWADGDDGHPDDDPLDDMVRPARPVRLPTVIAAVITVLLVVSGAGIWATRATGNDLPLHPVNVPAPALPPAS